MIKPGGRYLPVGRDPKNVRIDSGYAGFGLAGNCVSRFSLDILLEESAEIFGSPQGYVAPSRFLHGLSRLPMATYRNAAAVCCG